MRKGKKKTEYTVSYYDHYIDSNGMSTIDTSTLTKKKCRNFLDAYIFYRKLIKLFDSVEISYEKNGREYYIISTSSTYLGE